LASSGSGSLPFDTTRVYKLGGGQGNVLRRSELSYDEYRKLPKDQQAQYSLDAKKDQSL